MQHAVTLTQIHHGIKSHTVYNTNTKMESPAKKQKTSESTSLPAATKAYTADLVGTEYEQLAAVFPEFCDLFETFLRNEYKLGEDIIQRTRRMFEYTTLGGKCNRYVKQRFFFCFVFLMFEYKCNRYAVQHTILCSVCLFIVVVI
jgi:hypothetical protein